MSLCNKVCAYKKSSDSMYKKGFKRFFDICISLAVLLCLSPFLLIIIIWLYFAKDAKIFKVIKFKTMTDERDANGNLLPDAERLTRVGRFIRSASIDELPQLINVLKGDMSLIGPRPLRVDYLPLYNKEQARRHEVRSGITGWAQCHGRNAISWTEKFELDVWYVDHISFTVDLKIIFITVKKVFFREDINNDQEATMYPFDGTN